MNPGGGAIDVSINVGIVPEALSVTQLLVIVGRAVILDGRAVCAT